MPITVDIGEAGYVLHLEGEIEIGGAGELKNALVDALASGKEVRLDLASTADLDVTAIQLLWAAMREAAKTGTFFGVAGEMPKPVSRALLDSGFEKFLVSSNAGAEPASGQTANQESR